MKFNKMTMVLCLVMVMVSTFGLPAAAQSVSDRPTTPKITGDIEERGGQTTYKWLASADHDGIKGYNIYVNDVNVGWSTTNEWTSTTLDEGDEIYVIAVDKSPTPKFSNKSRSWMITSDGFVLAVTVTGGGAKPDAPNTGWVSRNQLAVSRPTNTKQIGGYNLYVNGKYQKTFPGKNLDGCIRVPVDATVGFSAYTSGTRALHSPIGEAVVVFQPVGELCFKSQPAR